MLKEEQVSKWVSLSHGYGVLKSIFRNLANSGIETMR